MFFLGMSAHLFIYLLVPAFLIVCFYFRGAAGSPEVDPILPEAVVYQQTGTSSFEKAYLSPALTHLLLRAPPATV